MVVVFAEGGIIYVTVDADGIGGVDSGGHVVVHVSLCGVDVIIFNAIERYVSCVMVVRVGPRSMAVDGCMLVPVCIVHLCVGYVCRNVCMMLCVCILVCLCACICPHMYVV